MQWKLDLLLGHRDQEMEFLVEAGGSPKPKKAWQSKSTHTLLMIPISWQQ